MLDFCRCVCIQGGEGFRHVSKTGPGDACWGSKIKFPAHGLLHNCCCLSHPNHRSNSLALPVVPLQAVSKPNPIQTLVSNLSNLLIQATHGCIFAFQRIVLSQAISYLLDQKSTFFPPYCTTARKASCLYLSLVWALKIWSQKVNLGFMSLMARAKSAWKWDYRNLHCKDKYHALIKFSVYSKMGYKAGTDKSTGHPLSNRKITKSPHS